MSDKTNAEKKVWWISNNKVLGLAQRTENTDGTKYSAISSSDVGKFVYIHAVVSEEGLAKSDTSTSAIGYTESPSIPEEFHEAITYYAIAKGYEKVPEGKGLNQAMYFRRLYREMVNEAKKNANRERSGAYSVKGYDF
tara:strand:+ start:695 stop:1108 length:414 start_codon:yes stop_codon:yes gene_type:complete